MDIASCDTGAEVAGCLQVYGTSGGCGEVGTGEGMGRGMLLLPGPLGIGRPIGILPAGLKAKVSLAGAGKQAGGLDFLLVTGPLVRGERIGRSKLAAGRRVGVLRRWRLGFPSGAISGGGVSTGDRGQ